MSVHVVPFHLNIKLFLAEDEFIKPSVKYVPELLGYSTAKFPAPDKCLKPTVSPTEGEIGNQYT